MATGRIWCVVAGVLALAGAAESRTHAGGPTRPGPAVPDPDGAEGGTAPTRGSGRAAFPADPPLPPPRPDRPAPAEAADGEDAAGPASAPEPPVLREVEACRERLARLGVRFEIRPPLRDRACGAAEPLLVSRLPEDVAIQPAATMTCPVAEALARWTLDVLKPETERHFGTRPTKVLIGTSYECRNQRSGGKMSEHAFANGVDVMGFAFAARPDLAVGGLAEGAPGGAFLESVRKGACPYFTTVLGPGSDAAHADHLHLDLRTRRGGYRICQ